MTLSHNSLIRGYNSIYQQAPRIPASDYKDFIRYCLAWHRCVEEHHIHEEVNYFPKLRKRPARKELWMEKWINTVRAIASRNHYGAPLTLVTAAFHAGLKTFKDYLSSLKNPQSDFKPTRLLRSWTRFPIPFTHILQRSHKLCSLCPASHLLIGRLTSSRWNKSRARKQSR